MKPFGSTVNTRTILPDSLRFIRSDVPTEITSEEIQWLKENNILTVIDLRTEQERLQKICPLMHTDGFSYLCMPVTGGNAVPETPDDVSLSYIGMADDRMDSIIDTMLRTESNVLYFCNAGKDRTGVVSAILLYRLGFDEDYIIADYLKSADNLREILKMFADSNPGIDIRVITPERIYMEQFLAWLRKHQ